MNFKDLPCSWICEPVHRLSIVLIISLNTVQADENVICLLGI